MFRSNRAGVAFLIILASLFLYLPASACLKTITDVRLRIVRHSDTEATVIVHGYCTMVVDTEMPCICGMTSRERDYCFERVTSVVIRDRETRQRIHGFDFGPSGVAADYFNEAFTTHNWNAFFSVNGPVRGGEGRFVTVEFDVTLDPSCDDAALESGMRGGRIGSDGADETERGTEHHLHVIEPTEVVVVGPTPTSSKPWAAIKRLYKD